MGVFRELIVLDLLIGVILKVFVGVLFELDGVCIGEARQIIVGVL